MQVGDPFWVAVLSLPAINSCVGGESQVHISTPRMRGNTGMRQWHDGRTAEACNK